MIKALVTFIITFVIVHVALMLWRDLTKQEKWSFVKYAAYSSAIACVVCVLLVLFVVLF